MSTSKCPSLAEMCRIQKFWRSRKFANSSMLWSDFEQYSLIRAKSPTLAKSRKSVISLCVCLQNGARACLSLVESRARVWMAYLFSEVLETCSQTSFKESDVESSSLMQSGRDDQDLKLNVERLRLSDSDNGGQPAQVMANTVVCAVTYMQLQNRSSVQRKSDLKEFRSVSPPSSRNSRRTSHTKRRKRARVQHKLTFYATDSGSSKDVHMREAMKRKRSKKKSDTQQKCKRPKNYAHTTSA